MRRLLYVCLAAMLLALVAFLPQKLPTSLAQNAEANKSKKSKYKVPGPRENKKQKCDYYASVRGSDNNSGRKGNPFRSAPKLVSSLGEGEHGCFYKGRYSFSGQLSIRKERTKLMSVSGQKATLKGAIRIEESAKNSVIKNLYLNGRNENKYLGPLIYADGFILRNNDITNHHQAICVHVSTYSSPPRGVKIIKNKIHHCGHLPPNNFEHGIYLASGSNALIRGNWIYKNADRGIQFYPDADNNKVIKNVIYKNGQGVIFGGSDNNISQNNKIFKNIIVNSRVRYNVESSGINGNSNIVRNNCLYTPKDNYYSGEPKNSGIMPGNNVGFVTKKNKIIKPLFKNQKRNNYTLRRVSPCQKMQ